MHKTLEERLLEKRLITDDGHWLFVGALAKGHGVIWYNGKLEYVHRLAAYLYFHKNCFNPDCLYVGSQKQNMMDQSESGRHHMLQKTRCPKGHPYNLTNTRLLTHNGGKPRRDCITCHNESNKRYRESKKLVSQ